MKAVYYVIYQEEAEDWSVHSLQYPVATCGDTKEEALKMFEEALTLYLEDESCEAVEVKHPEIGNVMLHA